MAAAARIRFQNRLVNRNIRRERVFRERVNPLYVYISSELYDRFRFTDDGIIYLVNLLRYSLANVTFRSFAVPPLLKLFLALRFLATGSFQIVIGDTLGLSQPTVCRIVWNVIRGICRLAPRFIKYPTDVHTQNEIKRTFFAIGGIPGVTSLINCTHIRIMKPNRNEDAYVNRKQVHSINIQATMDCNYKYTSVVAKYPGSMHDHAILKETALYENHENNTVQGVLLGDSGYQCSRWLWTPHRNPGQGTPESRFNRYKMPIKILVF